MVDGGNNARYEPIYTYTFTIPSTTLSMIILPSISVTTLMRAKSFLHQEGEGGEGTRGGRWRGGGRYGAATDQS